MALVFVKDGAMINHGMRKQLLDSSKADSLALGYLRKKLVSIFRQFSIVFVCIER